MSEKQIKERINKLQFEIRILEKVLGTEREGFGRPKGSLKYTPEQIDFLEKNKDIPMEELIEMFNEKFGTGYPIDSRALYNFMDRQGIILPQRKG